MAFLGGALFAVPVYPVIPTCGEPRCFVMCDLFEFGESLPLLCAVSPLLGESPSLIAPLGAIGGLAGFRFGMIKFFACLADNSTLVFSFVFFDGPLAAKPWCNSVSYYHLPNITRCFTPID